MTPDTLHFFTTYQPTTTKSDHFKPSILVFFADQRSIITFFYFIFSYFISFSISLLNHISGDNSKTSTTVYKVTQLIRLLLSYYRTCNKDKTGLQVCEKIIRSLDLSNIILLNQRYSREVPLPVESLFIYNLRLFLDTI